MRTEEQGETDIFTGFPPDAFLFFNHLQRNNRREWFAERKALYQQTLAAPMLLLVQNLAVMLHAIGLPLEPARRDPVHRIYRDTRFSREKLPFHTHIASALYRDSHKKAPGALYLHLDARAPFLAAGFWEPEKAELRRWRDQIVADPLPLLHLVDRMPLETENRLKRLPRGYEHHAASSGAHLLSLKSFVMRRPLPVADLYTQAILESMVGFAKDAAPLLRYGWALESPGRPIAAPRPRASTS